LSPLSRAASPSAWASLAAVALGLSVPAAGAKPIDSGPAGSFIAANSPATLVSSPSAAGRTDSGASSEWEVVAAASGAVSLTLVGVGATLLTNRRRRQRRAAGRPTVAA